jgi:raffinose/stachyose/melibiose transport system substrate-binding protein
VIWELPATTTANYTTWLGTQLAAGTIRPDVVSGNYFPSFAKYFNYDQVRKNMNPHTGRPWDQDLDWDFNRSRNAKGERVMLPTRAVHTMYYYNKELFAKAKAKPPLNWNEFIDTCRTLKTAGITPIAANWLFQVPQWIAEIYFDQYHVDWAQVVRAQKGDWNYDPAIDDKFAFDAKDPLIHSRYTYSVQRYFRALRDGTIKFDNPGMAEMIKNLAEIFPKYATSDMFVLDDSYPPFLQQQVAIMSAHTGSIPTLNNDMKAMTPDRLKELKLDEKSAIRPFEWGFFENPHMEGPLVKTTAKAVESAVGEYVSIVDKDQRQTELTLDFVMFWLSKAGYQPFLEGAAKAGLRFRPSGPLMVKDVKDPPEIQKGFADVKFVGNAEANYNNFLNWGGAASPHRETARNLYKEALEGKMPPSDYGKRLDALIKGNFDDIVKRTLLTKEDIDNPAKQPGT